MTRKELKREIAIDTKKAFEKMFDRIEFYREYTYEELAALTDNYLSPASIKMFFNCNNIISRGHVISNYLIIQNAISNEIDTQFSIKGVGVIYGKPLRKEETFVSVENPDKFIVHVNKITTLSFVPV